MKKIKLVISLIFISVFVFQSCKNDDKVVKVGYLPMVSSLAHFVAKDQGYYEQEGIKIAGSQISTSDQIANDLVAGQINAAIELSLTSLLQSVEKNTSNTSIVKIYSMSNITEENGFDGIIVRKESPVLELKDLSGKKVGLFPGSTAKNFLTTVFEQHYPELPLPEMIPLKADLQIQQLESGHIDALFAYESNLTTGMVKHQFRKICPSIYAMHFSPSPIGVAAFNSSWEERNPGLAVAYLRAIDKAIVFIRENPIKAREILVKATGYDPEIASSMNIMPMSLSSEVNKPLLLEYFKSLKVMGEISVVPVIENITQ
jgi:ABC-type nitrate/sulfonate/bicarbonate transport system substrate-binding protein